MPTPPPPDPEVVASSVLSEMDEEFSLWNPPLDPISTSDRPKKNWQAICRGLAPYLNPSGGASSYMLLVPTAVSGNVASFNSSGQVQDSGSSYTWIPSSTQKQALAGTHGTPGSANKFVTDSDNRHADAGTIENVVYTDNGDGTVTVEDIEVILYDNPSGTGNPDKYVLTGGDFSAVPGVTRYIIGKYNGGTPIMTYTDNRDDINCRDVIPIITLSGGLSTNFICILPWHSVGVALPEKLFFEDVDLRRFEVKPGGMQTRSKTGLYITQTPGRIWYGGIKLLFDAFDSQTDTCYLLHHLSGSFTITDYTGVPYPTDLYDDGVDLQTLSNNRYAVLWAYRLMSENHNKHVVFMLGEGNYGLDEAVDSQCPVPPSSLSIVGELCAKIIIQKGSSSPYSITQFVGEASEGTQSNDHQALSNLQGGSVGEYYHLSSSKYNEVNAFNSVSVDTVIDLTYGTISCTVAGKTMTLPTAVNIAGRVFVIDNASSGDIYVATTGSQTINGETTQTVPKDSCMVVFSNGANWRIR